MHCGKLHRELFHSLFFSGLIQISHANMYHLLNLSLLSFCTECSAGIPEQTHSCGTMKALPGATSYLWSHWLRAQLQGENSSAIPLCWHASAAVHSRARHLRSSRRGLPTFHCTSGVFATREPEVSNPFMTSANTASFSWLLFLDNLF